jgi:hypothetical protein
VFKPLGQSTVPEVLVDLAVVFGVLWLAALVLGLVGALLAGLGTCSS